MEEVRICESEKEDAPVDRMSDVVGRGIEYIMAVMMTGGIYLRVSGVAPERFIAVFYTGLGASLSLAGILFGKNWRTSNAAK